MKKLNPKGFTGLEIILAIVVIMMIGGGSLYVYQRNQDEKTDPTESWNTYDNGDVPFSFKYPGDWTLKTSSGYSAILLKAPNTETQESSIGGQELINGAIINAYKTNDPKVKSLSDYKSSGPLVVQNGSTKDIKLDGNAALQYDLDYEGSASHGVIFFYKGNIYTLGIAQKAYKNQSYAQIFDNFLSSIKFK